MAPQSRRKASGALPWPIAVIAANFVCGLSLVWYIHTVTEREAVEASNLRRELETLRQRLEGAERSKLLLAKLCPSGLLRAEAQTALSQVVTVTEQEQRGEVPCSFQDETGATAQCLLESPEHKLVRNHIPPNATVLEFGGRYGTTTCEIAAKLGNSGKLLVAEPDHRVWDAFERNVAVHKCNAHLLKGVVGSEGKELDTRINFGYATRTAHLRAQGSQKAQATSFSMIEACLGLQFDTLLIDCEGCVEDILNENPGALDGIRTIVMETDMGMYNGVRAPDCNEKCIDYDAVASRFQHMGFRLVETIKDQEPGWLFHLAFTRD